MSTENKKYLLLYGNTCTGKSTLAIELRDKLGFNIVSFGDIKRAEVNKNTQIGIAIRKAIQQGNPIDPNIGISLLKPNLYKGYNCICGFPISEDEINLLLKMNCIISGIIVLEATEKTIANRLSSRGVCPICHYPGVLGNMCPYHETNSLIPRHNPADENLEGRIKLYNKRILPFLNSNTVKGYPNINVSTDNISPDEVFSRVEKWITQDIGITNQ